MIKEVVSRNVTDFVAEFKTSTSCVRKCNDRFQWDWIRTSFLLVPKADSKIVPTWFVESDRSPLYLHFLHLHICFSWSFHIFIDHLSSMLCRLFSLSWVFCLSLVLSGPKCVSTWSDNNFCKFGNSFISSFSFLFFLGSIYLEMLE